METLLATLAGYLYVVSAVLFVLSLKWMSAVKTSRMGNAAGTIGMVLAIGTTLLAYHVDRVDLLLIAAVVGTAIGVPIALKLPMTAVPQRTAMSHAFGSLAVALIGMAEYYQRLPTHEHNLSAFVTAVLSVEMMLGFLTFTGSVIAFLKLQETISGKPLIYPGRNYVSIGVLVLALFAIIALVIDPTHSALVLVIMALALVFGFLLVMGIGGADMPTVIAILNSYAGLSAAALGFVLNNKLLIVAGTLDGASGFILAILMCKAMNRSFVNVLFGGLGQTVSGEGTAVVGDIKPLSTSDAYLMLEGTNSVVFVPGYGMAVAQAQHVVHELGQILEKQGTAVQYAIHPVAGRMPGHMNVLLAEAGVPYEQLVEMDIVNTTIDSVDVAIVIGANDVVNPAAKEDEKSPLYGMPIIDVDRARTVIAMKRSMRPGFAGVENPLFYKNNTRMLFGDAKQMLTQLVAEFKEAES